MFYKYLHTHRNKDEASGDTTLVYGVAHLKDGILQVSVDSRYAISQDKAALESGLRAHWAEHGWQVVDYDMTTPFYMPKDDPRVAALQQLYTEVTGREDEPYTMGGGTYARWLPNTVAFGSAIESERSYLGDERGGPHQRDEYISEREFYDGMLIYSRAIGNLSEIL